MKLKIVDVEQEIISKFLPCLIYDDTETMIEYLHKNTIYCFNKKPLH